MLSRSHVLIFGFAGRRGGHFETLPKMMVGQLFVVRLKHALLRPILNHTLPKTSFFGNVWLQRILGIAECKYEFPSFPTLLPKEKGARILVPSPVGRGLG